MGSEPFLLASTLKLAIAQRLVRRLSPESRVEVKMGKAEAKAIGEQLKELGFGKEVIDEWTSIPLFKVDPSIGRLNSGFKGRVGIFEMLEVTDTVREMILEKTPGHELRAEMIRQGHMPMFLFGLELVKQGITTFEEIMRVAQE
jgi:type II secretory ATPase GspE/PulE/Tfp pilus assembly ATPase PilB-like protein